MVVGRQATSTGDITDKGHLASSGQLSQYHCCPASQKKIQVTTEENENPSIEHNSRRFNDEECFEVKKARPGRQPEQNYLEGAPAETGADWLLFRSGADATPETGAV